MMICNMAASSGQTPRSERAKNAEIRLLMLDTVFAAVLKTQLMKPLSESGFRNEDRGRTRNRTTGNTPVHRHRVGSRHLSRVQQMDIRLSSGSSPVRAFSGQFRFIQTHVFFPAALPNGGAHSGDDHS